MSKYKILFKLTGSIAAYKSAYLISKLVQNNFEVQTVVSDSALQFIGKATLEGLTGKEVLSDTYENGKMMSHINLIKWADIVLLCPASANTINKMANGIADNLITTLFLAHDWNKPYIIAPAMNSKMYNHPITKNSLNKLESIGVKILPTDSGYLACGDVGEGKLLDPDLIYNHLISTLVKNENKSGNVLITAGATREYIDGVRFISNISTGKTAASIANVLFHSNYQITYLHSVDSVKPDCIFNEYIFDDLNSLKEKLYSLLESNSYDLVIHSAAISDYTIDNIELENSSFKPDIKTKISSEHSNLTLKLKKTEKLLNQIKKKSLNKNIILVAFKFIDKIDLNNSSTVVNKLFENSEADFVVLNALSDRDKFNTQKKFYLYGKEKLISKAETAEELTFILKEQINKQENKNVIKS